MTNTDIYLLSRALDELEASIVDGRNALRELADVHRNGAPVTNRSTDEQTAAGLVKAAELATRRFERVREELRKYLPQQLAMRAADLRGSYPPPGDHEAFQEWLGMHLRFLELVAGARIDSAPDNVAKARALLADVERTYGPRGMGAPDLAIRKLLDRTERVLREIVGDERRGPPIGGEGDREDSPAVSSGGADMIRGLVRCAESAERMGGGALWDDTSRKALEAARAAGWGNNKVGRLDGMPGVDEVARKALADLVERADRDVRRYSRLRILGVAPSGTKQLEAGSVLCFQNLDDFVDADLAAHPNRGEAVRVIKSAMTSSGARERHIYDAADRSRYCKWCNEEESHPVHLARTSWEEAPAVRDQLWVAALKHADVVRRDIDAGLTSAQIRDEIIGKVGMMASARTPEMQARYDAALERERLDAQPDPTQESVNRQVQHDLAVTAARMVIDNPDAVRKLNPADFRRMATIVLASCKHHHFESHPLAGRRCLVCRTDAADIPPRRHVVLTEEQLSMALRCSVDEWSTSATEGTLFDLWCNHVGVTANTYEGSLAYAAFRAARDYFRTVTPAGASRSLDEIARIIYEERYQEPRDARLTEVLRDQLVREIARRALELAGARPVAELAYEVPPAPLVADDPTPSIQDRQEALLTALDEMRRALMALRLEVPQSVADEMLKRFEAVVRTFQARHAGPSAELVALRFFHDNVSARCRKFREEHMSTTYTQLDVFIREVLDNGGQALMKPRQLDAITVTVSGTAPATTGGTVVSAGTWTEMPPVTVTKGADGTLSVGPPPDGRPISEHLDDLAAGSNKRTPEQRVIDYARRVVSRGIHNRRTLDEMMRGKDLNLLHNDLQGLIWLAEAVKALDKEKP